MYHGIIPFSLHIRCYRKILLFYRVFGFMVKFNFSLYIGYYVRIPYLPHNGYHGRVLFLPSIRYDGRMFLLHIGYYGKLSNFHVMLVIIVEFFFCLTLVMRRSNCSAPIPPGHPGDITFFVVAPVLLSLYFFLAPPFITTGFTFFRVLRPFSSHAFFL